MEVTLVKPLMGNYRKVELSMSILYLATHLHRNGHKVRIIDCQIDEEPEKSLRSLLKNTDCFGFSVMTSQIAHALKLSDFIKGIDPHIPIVWGGIHPTIHPEQTIEDPSVDYVIRGEGEQTFVDLCRHLEGKLDESKIPGLVYKKGGRIHVNPDRPFLDLNSLSPPEWELFDMKKYIQEFRVAGVSHGMSLPVHSGRGCSYRCAFCISAKRWRPLTSRNILNEISVLKERYGVEHVDFIDENFFIDRRRVEEVSKTLIEKKIGISWYATCRVNYFNESHVNADLLNLAKRAGCDMIGMGIESGSQRILDLIKKDITVDDAVRAVRECTKVGIQPVCSFMIGLPGENIEDMNMTLDLIMKIKRINPDALVIGPQIFRPYPGCELYDVVKGTFNAPKTLRDWIRLDPMGGYTTADRLTWNEHPSYVANAGFYVDRANYDPEKFWMKAAEYPIKRMAMFRLRHKMFGFPFERSLFQTGQKLYYKMLSNRRARTPAGGVPMES
jgi:anaerobic magnesium-protoporphyrin IX monomethyl ester cyclase